MHFSATRGLANIFRSDDGGQSFVQKDEGVSHDDGWCIHSLAQDPNDADRIFRHLPIHDYI